MNHTKDWHQGTKMSNRRCCFTILHSLLGECRMRQRIYPGVFIIGLLLCSTTVALATCTTSIIASTPTADFIVNGDGTVTHKKTGLMWKVCSEGVTWSSAPACTTAATTFTWQSGLVQAQTVNSSGFAGFTDWRVPNKKELDSIVEVQCVNPSINAAIFPSTILQLYWSASPRASNTTDAWVVSFDTGGSSFGSKSSTHVVRLVRGGQ